MKMGKLTGEDEIAVEMLVALEDYGLDNGYSNRDC